LFLVVAQLLGVLQKAWVEVVELIVQVMHVTLVDIHLELGVKLVQMVYIFAFGLADIIFTRIALAFIFSALLAHEVVVIVCLINIDLSSICKFLEVSQDHCL